MNIEIYNPQNEVKEWIIRYTQDKLMELHRLNKGISADTPGVFHFTIKNFTSIGRNFRGIAMNDILHFQMKTG
jgi:hypothetical protein